jgi:hypothetical protein
MILTSYNFNNNNKKTAEFLMPLHSPEQLKIIIIIIIKAYQIHITVRNMRISKKKINFYLIIIRGSTIKIPIIKKAKVVV